MALTTFTSGQILTAAQMNAVQANDYNQTVSTKTASYTLVAADKGTRVVMNSASATTITVNTSLFSAGDTLVLQNISTGVCTVTAGTATVSTAGSLAIPQNGSGILYFTSAGVSIYYPSAVTANPDGLTFITGASFTTSSAISLPANTFTSTYQNYLIVGHIFPIATGNFSFRLRASGTDETGSIYLNAGDGRVNSNEAVTIAQNPATSVLLAYQGDTAAGIQPFILNVFSPQIAQRTGYLWNCMTSKSDFGGIGAWDGGGQITSATVFDALSFISSGTNALTGNYKVYGYQNS